MELCLKELALNPTKDVTSCECVHACINNKQNCAGPLKTQQNSSDTYVGFCLNVSDVALVPSNMIIPNGVFARCLNTKNLC